MVHHPTNTLYMFYEAYDLFNEGRYQESADMFSRLSLEGETPNIRYWSLVFSARCMRMLRRPGELELLKSACNVFPQRAEAAAELGYSYYINGDLERAEKFLKQAYSCEKAHRCVRYEADKYFEFPHEILIEMCLKQCRYNDAEELTTTLLKHGREGMYDRKKADYNHLYSRFYNNAGMEFLKAKSVNKGDSLVIQLPPGYDGLGDNIIFSHIPRIAKEVGGFNKVFVSTQANYKLPGYSDIVWSTNPHVDGFVDEPGTYTPSVQMNRVLDKWDSLLPSINIMDMIMYLHDLDDGKKGHVPECYYRPKTIDALKGKTLLDVGAKSLGLKGMDLDVLLKELESNGISIDAVVHNESFVSPNGIEVIKPSSIEEWADAMYSAKDYVCFNSGGYWLSGALGIKSTHVWIKGKTIPAWSFLDHINVFIDKATIFPEGT